MKPLTFSSRGVFSAVIWKMGVIPMALLLSSFILKICLITCAGIVFTGTADSSSLSSADLGCSNDFVSREMHIFVEERVVSSSYSLSSVVMRERAE